MTMRILNENFIDLDVVSNNYVSSAQAAFPVENIYNKQRRSKVWRSNGFWVVETGSNEIVFQETIAVDLVASVAVGEYTSSASFFAAIKAALEATGASTYTVSADTTTGKIKIVSNGTGGGGILSLIWTDPQSADMAALMGFDTASDMTGLLTYLSDFLRIHSNEWVKWDMGISTNPTDFVLIGPRNMPIKISPSSTLTLQGNETDAWSSPSYSQVLTYNDAVIYLSDALGLHTEALRYWRLLIEDLDNPNGYVEVGSLYLGDFYAPTRGCAQFPFGISPVDRTDTVFSEGGQTYSDIREKTTRFSISWNALTKEEKEEFENFFEQVGTGIPFFISMDSDTVWSTSSNAQIRYVKFENEPSFSLDRPNLFSMSMQLREEL